jgi:type II secretory pathway pseudopilin PulG
MNLETSVVDGADRGPRKARIARPAPAARARRRPVVHAFTLLEVLIAMGIFFVSVFFILDLVSQNLRAARALKSESVDITSAISDLVLTNRLEDGSESGDFGEFTPGYAWTRQVIQVATNGLFRVDVTIIRADPPWQKTTSLLLFKPDSQRRGGGIGGRGGLITR